LKTKKIFFIGPNACYSIVKYLLRHQNTDSSTNAPIYLMQAFAQKPETVD